MAENESFKEAGEHFKNAGTATFNTIKSLLPEGFWEHGREAQRETLLAFRSLVDAAIEGLEKVSEDMENAGKGKSRVEVE
jgi:hypothetical protein